MSVLLGSSGASVILGSSGGGVVLAGKALLTASDLTWQGQARFPLPETAYGRSNLAIRYVGGERRFLLGGLINFGEANAAGRGDIIEYRAPASLSTSSALASAPLMEQTRKWDDPWNHLITLTGYAPSGDGYHIGSILWDEATSAVYYTMFDGYGSGNVPMLGATVLHDDLTVTRYGPWYFRSSGATSSAPYKQIFQGFTPIPASAQADLDGHDYLLWGTTNAVAANAHYGPGMTAVTGLPPLATATDGVLYPSGSVLKVMDYSTEAGVSPYECHRNTNYSFIGSQHQCSVRMSYNADAATYNVASGSWSGYVPGLYVGDCLYVSVDDTSVDTFSVRMSVAAVGGTRVLEYWNGSAWAAVTHTTPNGSTSLTSADDNVFYWATPLSGWTSTTVNGQSVHLRLRSTGAALSVGTIALLHNCTYNVTDTGAGGLWQGSSDHVFGAAWVETATKHGMLCFGAQLQGARWYGFSTFWGEGVRYDDPYANFANENLGYHAADEEIPRMWVFDPMHMREVGLGTRAGNNTGINPIIEYDWRDYWPNIINTRNSLRGSMKQWVPYAWPSGLRFDDTTNQLFLLASSCTAGSEGPILQVWNVA